MTNYLVGQIEVKLGDIFKTMYSQCSIISASSEKEATKKYRELIGPRISFTPRCIGIVDDNNTLIISNYTLNYNSAKNLPLALGEQKNYLVSRLLSAPNDLSCFSFYIPEYITATSDKEAIKIYLSRHCCGTFPAHCFGYLDEQNRFIIPNINDYLK